MTVSTSANRASYSGNGATVAFSFPYYFLSSSHLVVNRRVTSSGADTVLVETTDYTVSGAGASAGGTVTLNSAPTSAQSLTIYRDPPRTQLTDLVENDPLPAEEVEKAYDKLTMLVQRLSDRMDRTLRQPDGDTSAISAFPNSVTRASKYLTFDASGNPETINSVTAVSAVAANSANINTLAAISSTLVSVAAISANVVTVAGLSASIATVAGLSANLATVAAISANVNSVATISANVTSVAAISAAIASVNAISAAILAVSAGGYLQGGVTSNLTVGYTATAYNAGTISTGTYTVTPANGNLQRYVNNGAHSIAAHSAGDYTVIVQMTNSASAGAVTTSSFTKVRGDTLSTTNGDDFLLVVSKINGFTLLDKVTLQ